LVLLELAGGGAAALEIIAFFAALTSINVAATDRA